MGMLLDKEWMVTMRMAIIGFQQIKEKLGQLEGLIMGKPLEAKQQLNEIETPEQFLLREMPGNMVGNIEGIGGYHVGYPATIVRKGDVKNQTTVLDLTLSPQDWKKIEAQKWEKCTEKIWEVPEMDSFPDRLIGPWQKENQRGDVFYNWPRFYDRAGIT